MDASTLDTLCMHLTNYSVNKKASSFDAPTGEDSVGSKMKLSVCLAELAKGGFDTDGSARRCSGEETARAELQF